MDATQAALTFGGAPRLAVQDLPADTLGAVLGVGYSLGCPHAGPEHAPYFLRTLSKGYTWAASTPHVLDLHNGRPALQGIVDIGDVPSGAATPRALCDLVARTVADLPAHVAPCVIGGDHSITLGVVEGVLARRQRNVHVLQFDHHLDLQIWGAAPGSPGHRRESIFHTNVMSHIGDVLGPGRLTQVGLAPFATMEAMGAPATAAYIADVGRQICLFSPHLTDPRAFGEQMVRGEDVYLTVDVDVLDSSVMVSTGYPAPVGLTVPELLRLVDIALDGNTLIGFDLVEFSAERDARDPRTLGDAARAALVFMHLLGRVVESGPGSGPPQAAPASPIAKGQICG